MHISANLIFIIRKNYGWEKKYKKENAEFTALSLKSCGPTRT